MLSSDKGRRAVPPHQLFSQVVRMLPDKMDREDNTTRGSRL